MVRVCVYLLFLLMCSALISFGAERPASAVIQATATVVPAMGFASAGGAQIVDGNRSRELPLSSEALRVHRNRVDGSALLISPTACITVDRRNPYPIITLIPTAN